MFVTFLSVSFSRNILKQALELLDLQSGDGVFFLKPSGLCVWTNYCFVFLIIILLIQDADCFCFCELIFQHALGCDSSRMFKSIAPCTQEVLSEQKISLKKGLPTIEPDLQ